jgi:hypothetical protein
MDTMKLEKFDRLIAFAEEHLEYLRGTIYEQYAEYLLHEVISEKNEYIARARHSN